MVTHHTAYLFESQNGWVKAREEFKIELKVVSDTVPLLSGKGVLYYVENELMFELLVLAWEIFKIEKAVCVKTLETWLKSYFWFNLWLV